MAVSFGMLGILLMLDVCFVVNYFVVRAMRRWTNRVAEQEGAAMEETDEKKNSSDVISNNFQGVVDLFNETLNANQEFAFAWVLGTVKLDPLRVKRFPGWKPIPYNLGIWTTSIFIVLATILLSPDLVTDQLGISIATLDADLCVTEVRDSGVKALRIEIESLTNINVAREQHQLMVDFHNALVNDTALYGVPPYECPNAGDISGLKEDWEMAGPFFPGYCGEALEAAIDVAQSRECMNEICDCPTLPDSFVFGATGLAGKKYCGEVCISVPFPCPKHTAEEEKELNDYRFHQYKFAEEKRRNVTATFPTSIPGNVASTATETADKILFQVEVASYLYIGYECMALFFPTPLVLFRIPVWAGIKQFLFGVQKPYFICFVVAVWWGIEYFRGIWYSPDIRLFVNNLRAGDPCFVDADYLLDRQMLLNEVCEELMPMGPTFRTSAMTINDVLTEVGYFGSSCGCGFPNEYLSKITEVFQDSAIQYGFNETMDLCTGNDCSTLYTPYENPTFLGNTSICTNATAARKMVFESAPEAETDFYDLWVASGFLAIIMVKFAVAKFGLALMALADPFIVCAGEFLWVPTDLGMEIQTASGSTERVQFLEAFDERGRALPTEMLEKWFNSKRRALIHIAFSRTIFWGIIVHLCMFNLFVTVQEELGAYPTIEDLLMHRDSIVLGVCLGFAALVILWGCKTVLKLNALPHSEAGETSDDSSQEDARPYRKQRGPSRLVLNTGEVVEVSPVANPYLERAESQFLQGTVIQVDTFDSATSTKLVR